MKGDEYATTGHGSLCQPMTLAHRSCSPSTPEVRRPSEEPFKAISPDNVATAKAAPNVAKAESDRNPVVSHSATGDTLPNPPPIETVVPCSQQSLMKPMRHKKTGRKPQEVLREPPETVQRCDD